MGNSGITLSYGWVFVPWQWFAVSLLYLNFSQLSCLHIFQEQYRFCYDVALEYLESS